MGSGKSLVANKLAIFCKKKAISIDTLIEAKEKRSIPVIFQESGEAYFRSLEKEIVKEAAQQKDVIIDCGGGVVLNQDNLDCLKKNGILIHLSASPDVIWERVKEARRPLLDVPNPQAKIKELLSKREPLYAQADYRIDTDHKTAEEICDEIMNTLKGKI